MEGNKFITLSFTHHLFFHLPLSAFNCKHSLSFFFASPILEAPVITIGLSYCCDVLGRFRRAQTCAQICKQTTTAYFHPAVHQLSCTTLNHLHTSSPSLIHQPPPFLSFIRPLSSFLPSWTLLPTHVLVTFDLKWFYLHWPIEGSIVLLIKGMTSVSLVTQQWALTQSTITLNAIKQARKLDLALIAFTYTTSHFLTDWNR